MPVDQEHFQWDVVKNKSCGNALHQACYQRSNAFDVNHSGTRGALGCEQVWARRMRVEVDEPLKGSQPYPIMCHPFEKKMVKGLSGFIRGDCSFLDYAVDGM